MERRNPYLILGVPFGVTREEAHRAFARRGRTLRAGGPATAQALADLTWALHQIDEGPRPPEAGLTPYRLPADPEAHLVDGPGVFAPPAEPSPVTDDEVAAALHALQVTAAHEHLHSLVLRRSRQTDVGGPW